MHRRPEILHAELKSAKFDGVALLKLIVKRIRVVRLRLQVAHDDEHHVAGIWTLSVLLDWSNRVVVHVELACKGSMLRDGTYRLGAVLL